MTTGTANAMLQRIRIDMRARTHPYDGNTLIFSRDDRHLEYHLNRYLVTEEKLKDINRTLKDSR